MWLCSGTSAVGCISKKISWCFSPCRIHALTPWKGMSASGKSFMTVGNPKARLLFALSKVLLSSRSMVAARRGIKVCAITRKCLNKAEQLESKSNGWIDENDQPRLRQHGLVPMQLMQEFRVVQQALGLAHYVGCKGERRLPRLRLQLHHATKGHVQMTFFRLRS